MSRSLVAAFLMATAAACVLGGYEFLRTPTTTLFVSTFGKASLPAVTAMIPVGVAAFTYLYMRLLSRLGPRRTLFVTSLGAALLVVLGWWGQRQGQTWVLWPLFLVREAYVVLLIEQYWSFLNSTLTRADAKRFNGPICGWASLGSIGAGVIGAAVVARFGTGDTMLLAAAATLPAAFISDQAYRLAGEPPEQDLVKGASQSHLSLGLFKTEPVLPRILSLVILSQLVSTVLGLAFQGQLQDAIPATDAQSAYMYGFFAWVNGLAAVLQFVAAPLLLHFVRPGLVHILIPVLHAVFAGVYLGSPGLTTAAVAYAAFKCVDYSVFRAAKELLYVPLSFGARYRAKEIIDVFGYRVSKGVTSGVIALLQETGVVFTEGVYVAVAFAAAGAWAALAVPLGKHYEDSDERDLDHAS